MINMGKYLTLFIEIESGQIVKDAIWDGKGKEEF